MALGFGGSDLSTGMKPVPEQIQQELSLGAKARTAICCNGNIAEVWVTPVWQRLGWECGCPGEAVNLCCR